MGIRPMNELIVDECAKAICANFREWPSAKDIHEVWEEWDESLKRPWKRAAMSVISHLSMAGMLVVRDKKEA